MDGDSGNLTCTTNEKNDHGFQRSFSLPPAQRKNKKLNLNSCNHENSDAKNSLHYIEEAGTTNKTEDSSFKHRFGSVRQRLRVSKKTDIRVSRFVPVGINLPADIVTTIHNVEEKSLIDAVRTTTMSNGTSNFTEKNHVHPKEQDIAPVVNSKKSHRKVHGNGINLVKLLQGGTKRNNNTASHSKSESTLVMKTVEIVRKPDEILGIFIKKKKVSIKAETAMQSHFNHSRNSDTNVREGIFVSKLAPACLAMKQSLLFVGDEILEVNTIPVSSLDIKVVATMMSQLQKKLILTVRTVQNSSKSPSYRDKKSVLHLPNHKVLKQSGKGFSNQKRKKSTTSLASLPEEDVFKNPGKNGEFSTLPSLATGADVKHSVYDNNYPVELQNSNSSENCSDNHNLIQTRFDESVQILLDAIANCDKASARNTSENEDLSTNFPLSSHSSASSHLNGDNSSSDKDSLLSEILQTVENENIRKTYMGSQAENLSQSGNVLFSNDYDVLESPVENEFVTLSSASSTQEVNLDDVDSSCLKPIEYRKKFEHSLSLNPTVSSGVSINSKSAETVKFFSSDVFQKSGDRQLSHNRDSGKHHASDSDISQNLLPSLLNTGYEKVFLNSRIYNQNVPKFPVTLTDVPPDVITMIQPLKPSHDHCNVTVDKKREWFNSGGLVSDELKKRIDGESNDKLNNGSTPTNSPKPPNHQVVFEKYNSSASNNNIVTLSSSSKFYFNVDGTPNTQTTPNSEVVVRRKSSLRSPIEKNAKSFFSVASANPGFSKSQTSCNNEEFKTSHLNGSGLTHKPDVTQCTSLEEQAKESKLLDQHKSKYDSQKVTSPNRSRKKNWKKITKKFRLTGNSSDVGMSEYACWTADDMNHSPKDANGDESSPGSTYKQDSAISNHYHPDASMANQRRLSRQLYLDNKNRELLQKSLSISQFQKYKPLPLIGNTNNSVSVDGCLVITLYGVKELKKGLCEAYCFVQVDDAATKRIGTTMQTCKGATTWNQCFEMIVNQAKNLHFTVYTWDTRGGKHKASSRAVINLPLLLQGSKSTYSYSNRLAVSLEPRGTLYIRLALESSPSSTGPLLFGADLQSIADRENGPSIVPTLVRSCIEEVEGRGMHIVGIYRLCGSAIVKKDLRRKLEESGGKVDLDANSYPDINVITGILKDFLRELPQPLFPPELLEVVTSAMEELPGPSPNSVISEPFAPSRNLFTSKENGLETNQNLEQKERSDALLTKIIALPASLAERATLYALMNHLKKVSLHSNVNKMICQNLAVCFGPVLLGPVSTSAVTSMDLDAAIGFKRHIQVLNYMISNWPAQPVSYIPATVVTRRKGKTAADRDSHRVSLTRRLSRVCVEDMETGGATEDSKGVQPGDLHPDPRASLASIPEDVMFCDPDVEMYSATHRIFKDS